MGIMLTIAAVMIKAVSDFFAEALDPMFASMFTGLAVILTLIGVLKGVIQSKGGKQKLVTVGIHAVIWIVGYFLIKVLVPVAIVAGLVLIILVYTGGLDVVTSLFSGGKKSAGESNRRSGSSFDVHDLPKIIYDESDNRWQMCGDNGHSVTYENDKGQQVTIYSGEVSGTNATTSAGNFHWY